MNVVNPADSSTEKPAVGSSEITTTSVIFTTLFPIALETESVTEKVPGVLYVITGFCSFEVAGSPPSNNQVQAVGSFRDSSVKVTSNGAHPDSTFALNAALGAANPSISTSIVAVEEEQGFEAVKVTTYVPFEAYVCVGSASSLVSPSPKSHRYSVASVELFVKATVSEKESKLKSATGSLNTLINAETTLELLPTSLPA